MNDHNVSAKPPSTVTSLLARLATGGRRVGRHSSLFVSLAALTLSGATFYFNLFHQSARLAVSTLEFRDAYDSNTDIFTIHGTLAFANYGNTNVLFAELSLMAPGSWNQTPKPLFTSTGIPRIIPKGDVALVPFRIDYNKPAREQAIKYGREAVPLTPQSSMMFEFAFLDSEGVQIVRRQELMTVFARALERSPAAPVPAHPTFGRACLYIRNILDSSDCYQTISRDGASRAFR